MRPLSMLHKFAKAPAPQVLLSHKMTSAGFRKGGAGAGSAPGVQGKLSTRTVLAGEHDISAHPMPESNPMHRCPGVA